MRRTRTSTNTLQERARPFLRWAGGKSKLVAIIAQHLPIDWDRGTYWEPFLGAGAMFFHLQPRHAVLSDLNAQLISCYKVVKKDAQGIGRRLQRHRRAHCTDHYYRVRDRYNRGQLPGREAADFIYLNKACFNGIFRVNTQGRFNVPWGGKAKPALPSRDELLAVSRALRRTRLLCCEFTVIIDRVKRGDFVYLDPPYPPLNGTAYFRHYTPQRFGIEDQNRVAQAFKALDRAGCKVLLTNAAIPEIESLYRRWHATKVPVRRWISSNGHRFVVNELIVTNY